jgi:predicted O-methyltransferase YrrM
MFAASIRAMDPQVRSVLDEIRAYGLAHDAGKSNRRERLRNLEPDTAALLSVMIRATRPRRVLELGTSNGYSTMWLAEALRAVGGRLTSVELDPARSIAASENLARAGLAGTVELRVQDAAVALSTSEDASWDMIFLDAERPAYRGYWPDLVRCLRPAGLLAVDNAISHAADIAEFRAVVSADVRVSEALAPTGSGALLVVREPEPRPVG